MRVVRRFHKWLMAVLGIQFLIWSLTGAYMVYLDIHYIHGDSLVHNKQIRIDPNNVLITPNALSVSYPKISQLTLDTLIDRPVYRFKSENQLFLVDARDGSQLSPVNKPLAVQIAQQAYTGNGTVAVAQLITDNPPFELSARHLPAWQIQFDDFASPTIYISGNSGRVVTKRHSFWRIFDWMFRFHIMDYQDSEIDNWLLFIITCLGIISVSCGLALTVNKLSKRPQARGRNQ